jgi:hypothetical protein
MIQEEEEEWTRNQLMGTLAKKKGPIINFVSIYKLSHKQFKEKNDGK